MIRVKKSKFRRTCKDDITIGATCLYQNKLHKIIGLDYSHILNDIEIYLQEIKRRI